MVIHPKVIKLGGPFMVRRALPQIKKRAIGPFIFWDHIGPINLHTGKNMNVAAHPHIGLATITWLFSGQITHRDSLGNEQVIHPGEVNWMTAGQGVAHSERTHYETSSEILEGIQLWLALPKAFEDIEASFFHCKQNEIPRIEENGLTMQLIAGEAFGKTSPVPVFSELFYISALASRQARFNYPLKTEHEAAIYIISGRLKINGQSYGECSLIVLKTGSLIEVSVEAESRFMLFGGKALPEKRHMWWNFVSTDKAKIEQAKRRWKNQQFPPVIHETETIPLPE